MLKIICILYFEIIQHNLVVIHIYVWYSHVILAGVNWHITNYNGTMMVVYNWKYPIVWMRILSAKISGTVGIRLTHDGWLVIFPLVTVLPVLHLISIHPAIDMSGVKYPATPPCTSGTPVWANRQRFFLPKKTLWTPSLVEYPLVK